MVVSRKSSSASDSWTFKISLAVTTAAIAVATAHLIWARLKIDFVMVILLAVASLPWLRGIVTSIGLPGGASIKLAERQRVIIREERQTIDAIRAVATADQELPPDERLPTIYRLADQYEQLREDMPSSTIRTEEMERISREILSLMPLNDYDPDPDLLSQKAGRRLVAYLSVVAKPDPSQADELSRALTEREGIPFNLNWAIRALRLLVNAHGGMR